MPLRGELKDDGEKQLALRLVGKIISNKPMNHDAIMGVLPKIWATQEDFGIEVVASNTFSFTFKNHADRRRVLLEGPWSFDRALLVLEEPREKGDIKNMKFGKMGIGLIIRNSNGFVTAASAQPVFSPFSPQVIEALAIYKGILFAKDSWIMPLCIKSLLGSYPLWNVNFVPWLANKAAHGLAKYGLAIENDLFWLEDFPPIVGHAILEDFPKQ
ncbi:hypothetical protein Dsin_024050 [Dipteronia sinensis]|uniref:DUF4283 domain-containing protein n=1 Tax=Dipteronia sinensis TaxID=43782 RepID=A0AAE0E183_9ROSI|nr:hypothetical protein Dsin_024050 [Dipteronia sinensis]